MAEKKERVIKEVIELNSETSKNIKKKEAPKKPTPPKPYVHIDTFLQSAIPLFNMNKMQASGFKARMNGRHYQRDEKVFVDELKKYLNLK